MNISGADLDSDNRTGFFVGPMAEFTLPVIGLGVDAALLYDNKSVKVDSESKSLHYIDIPINVKYTIGLGSLASVYGATGPQFSYNIGNKKWNGVDLDDSDFSWNIGAGVKLLGHLQVGYNYNIALGNTAEFKETDAMGKIDKIKKLHNNKIVLSSTAYYQYNHLWQRVKGYIDIIMEKAEKAAKMRKAGLPIPPDLEVELRGHDLNNQIPFNIMKDENRALIAFNCEDMPDGFMNTESLEEAKREMPRYQYLMEYFGYFPPDSEGFFPMSLLDKSRKHGDFTCEFSFDHNKEKDWITIMGCDPARSGDNFAISIFKVNLKTEKIRLIRILTYSKMTFPFMHLEIRRLRKLYDVSEIAIDSGGGGQTIRDLLADPKICPPGDDIILQRDFDEHRFKHGKRILRLVEFSRYEWLSDANNNLLLGLQNGMLQIAGEKGSLKNASDFDETPDEEAARREIDKTIEEMQNIIVTRTQTGRMHWDTPQKHQRKDRYSSVLIGYDQAYSYLDNINKPQSLVSGFWAN
jgi:hypothetical protein